MQQISDSPPRAPPIKYTAPLGTRWAKEKAAAGGAAAFDLPTDPKSIGPWILGECVGKGASGRVKIAKHRRTGQLAAVKILPIAPLVSSRASLATQQAKSDKQRLGIDREITMMKLMNHPNIMRIYDVYEGDKELFLVLEYVEGGELFDFLVNRGRLPPNEALIYFRQIVYGLNYAHTFSIIHRDLKPENILIASLSPPQLKIADWGMAAFAPPSLQLETSCGSPHYASPEIVNGEKYEGNATDIWSCGVILYALLTGRLPFDDKNVRTLLSKVKSGKYEMPAWIDPLAKDLLSKMLIVDVKQRITIPEILSHPWLIAQPNIPFAASDGSTYTLLAPPLPPSPTILGRPLLSPDLIDAELFSSLRIIWGRHADPEGNSILRDLCAPAGQGIHAKAFYFLLGKYREESYRNRTKDAQYELRLSSNASSTIDLETLKFNFGWEIESSSGLKKYEGPRMQVRSVFSPPRTSSATVSATDAAAPSYSSNLSAGAPPGIPGRKRTITDGSIPPHEKRSDSSTTSGSGSAAKAGSTDAPVTLDKPSVNNIMANARAKLSLGIGRGGPRALPQPRRGQTYSTIEGRENDHPSALGFSQHLQQLQARTASGSSQRPKSAVVPNFAFSEAEKKAMFTSVLSSSPANSSETPIAPTPPRQPLGALKPPNSAVEMVSIGSLELPLLTAPKMDNPQLQRTMNDITQKVNELVQSVVTQASPPAIQAASMRGDRERNPAGAHLHHNHTSKGHEDKENDAMDEESWSHVSGGDQDRSDRSGCVGLGVGVAANRDPGVNNPGPLSMSPAKARKEKEKKGRPPPLDLPTLNPKRSTFGILASPIALASPLHNYHHHAPSSANRILASPVVGEFKGWFSNLFNWKHSNGQHGGVLYSGDDIHLTRANVARLLENLGVSLANTPGEFCPQEQAEILFCRIDALLVDHTTGVSMKPVRFRVEFRAGPGPAEMSRDQTMASPNAEDAGPYFLSAPPANDTAMLVTPNPASATAPRSRASMLLGRGGPAASHGAMHSMSLPSPSVLSKWEFPPGCLCAIALVHEKGSMTTFKAVWRRLKEEYGDASTAYPCFSPAMPEIYGDIPGFQVAVYLDLK
ncbi:Pkinase-domain-containing protein [Pholiota conissans]|uniref:Pkinase-domain-containing protein n=1 Tax=Pholiota conissans TaxID=109636 RepID=A0A9P6CUI2_9AGAR|nr:Pkinase-domain-containing protein [Pholiota conissans]